MTAAGGGAEQTSAPVRWPEAAYGIVSSAP